MTDAPKPTLTESEQGALFSAGITRKPKQEERLLSPAEIAAIEIECEMEPSWKPPLAVPSGVWTAIPGTDLEVWQGTGHVCAWAEGQGWLGLTRKRQEPKPPPVASLVTRPKRAAESKTPEPIIVPAWSGCDDCETEWIHSWAGERVGQVLSEPCRRHRPRPDLPPTTCRNERH